MAKRGRPKSPEGIEGMLTLRPDATTRDAVKHDLDAMRKRHPAATRSDVIRTWARLANRKRAIEHEAKTQALVESVRTQNEILQQRIKDLERHAAGFEKELDRGAAKDIALAVRLLRNDRARLQAEIHHLVELETAGLRAESSNRVLQRAHGHLASWQELLDRAGGPP